MDKVFIIINQFFKYMYGGVLVLIILTVFKVPEIEMVYLDGFIFFAVAMTLGAAIYILYKNIVSEWLIENKIHAKMPGHSHKCVFAYLGERGVNGKQAQRTVFKIICDDLFGEKINMGFEKRHEEIHLLYLTASILFFTGLSACVYVYVHMAKFGILSTSGYKTNIAYVGMISSVFCLLAYWVGIRSDLNLCSDEKAYLKILEGNDKYKEIVDGVIKSIKKDEKEGISVLKRSALLGIWTERVIE